ncbi:MAG: SspB family protein [Hyphomicrobium sp.]
MATEPTIDYEALQQEAMRGVVRAVLQQTVKNGLSGDHHFYVSFLTQAPGVILSKRLREKYPHEMTIVLQHRFWDLIVSDDQFEVKLTFDSVPERLVIPFAAIKVFIDPSVRFGLQFEDAGVVQEKTAPRRSLTVDAAFDQVGEARAESPRATIAKKPRPARKPKAEKDQADVKPAPTQMAAPQAAPSPPPAGVQDNAVRPATGDAGAKILSLDQFRKK